MTSTHNFLDIVHTCGQRNIPIRKVYRRMKDKTLFLAAYGKLYANQGSLTKGITEETVDGMSIQRIETILKELEEGAFTWTPVRRVYIPKRNGKPRPLGVPTWKDKLVQEVIRMILEAYYEPQFRDSSHGFRPNRGCHTALTTIRDTWSGTIWFIEGDIKGCFDNLQHNLILKIIERNIHDTRFLKLIREMLEAGYMEDWQFHRTYSGTPQGGIVSPLLANIVLHELDAWVEETLIPAHARGERRRANTEYNRLTKYERQAWKAGNVSEGRKWRSLKWQHPQNNPHDPNYARLRYCRYADDFILGWAGSLEEAKIIRDEIASYLQDTLKLELSMEKTLVTHATTERARFLGYELKVSRDNSKTNTIKHHTGHTIKQRNVNGRIQLLVPNDVKGQWVKRFFDVENKAIKDMRLIHLPDFDIIAHYGGQWRGLVNYYVLAMNIKILSHVEWAMSRSLQATLARKHNDKTRSIRKQYLTRIDGKRAMVCEVLNPNKPGKTLKALFGGIALRTRRQAYLNDQLYVPFIVTTQLVARLLAETCELCGHVGDTEVHHIRKLADLKRRWKGKPMPIWATRMSEMNRKTLVVCQVCHREIHDGTYDGHEVK
jgi:group II intron reverse transcriptase/maturase